MRGRIIIAESCPSRRIGIRTVLSSDSDLEVVGETGCAGEVPALARDCAPDVLLLDGQLGRTHDLMKQVRAEAPGMGVLVWLETDEAIHKPLQRAAGGLGCLPRQATPEAVVRAVKEAVRTVTGAYPEGGAGA